MMMQRRVIGFIDARVLSRGTLAVQVAELAPTQPTRSARAEIGTLRKERLHLLGDFAIHRFELEPLAAKRSAGGGDRAFVRLFLERVLTEGTAEGKHDDFRERERPAGTCSQGTMRPCTSWEWSWTSCHVRLTSAATVSP